MASARTAGPSARLSPLPSPPRRGMDAEAAAAAPPHAEGAKGTLGAHLAGKAEAAKSARVAGVLDPCVPRRASLSRRADARLVLQVDREPGLREALAVARRRYLRH